MKTIIWILIVWAILFLFAAFIQQGFDPSEWTKEARFILTIVWVVSAVVTVGIIEISEDK